jgi:hypothetical protein
VEKGAATELEYFYFEELQKKIKQENYRYRQLGILQNKLTGQLRIVFLTMIKKRGGKLNAQNNAVLE